MTNYNDVIKDLEAKRNEIDQAIVTLRKCIAVQGRVEPIKTCAPVEGSEQALDPTANTDDVDKGIDWLVDKSFNQKEDDADKNKIGLEDIVECVHVQDRDPGVDQDTIPVVGKQYRVIDFIRRGKSVVGYDVLDDVSGTRQRMPVFAQEVKLARKRSNKTKKVDQPSLMIPCPKCDAPMAVSKHHNDIYDGQCLECGFEDVAVCTQKVNTLKNKGNKNG